ncbi:MAG TPA: LLM class flavin-dependent oxidoreductase [Candidatus Dormibacteraeota bacterium]|nr:LLM class flavin-dependent oxidoreductase [Candidatus Dormibacteraeota bacterium]
MRLGVLLTPGRQAGRLSRLAEDLGFESVWFVDSPAVFGDPFVSMAVAATTTEWIKLATGVINPVSRPAALAAASLCSIEALAPGRVMAGVGVGHTGVVVLGLRRGRSEQLATYVRDLRVLTGGGEVTTASGARQRLPPDQPDSLAVGRSLPIVVAAAGRRNLKIAVEQADEVLLGGITDPAIISRVRAELVAWAAAAGRPEAAGRLSITPSVFLARHRPSLDELRWKVGPKSLAPALSYRRWVQEVYGDASPLGRQVQAIAAAYASAETSAKRGRSEHLDRYRGYMSRLEPWQVELITEELIALTAVVGTPEDWLERLAHLERIGIHRVILSPIPSLAEQTIRDCGALVLPHL